MGASEGAEAEMQLIQDAIGGCRMLRQTYGLPPAQQVAVELRISNDAKRDTITRFQDFFSRMARVTATITAGGAAGEPVKGAAKTIVGSDIEIVMPLGGLDLAPLGSPQFFSLFASGGLGTVRVGAAIE